MSTHFPTQDNHRGIDTSIAAAEQAALSGSELRALVHRILFAHPAGLTVDELCAKAKRPRYSLQPRFTELKHMGMIRDTGARRRNVSGANAIVWRATVLDRIEVAA